MKENYKTKTACVCWTPYQVFNTINFIENNLVYKNNCDLFLLDIPALKGLKEKILNEELFENVYTINNYQEKNYIVDRCEKAIDIIFPNFAIKRNLKGIPNRSIINYDAIIASGWIKYFICLASVNKNAKIIFLEDGIASYLGDFREKEMPISYKLLNKITNKGPLSIIINEEYLYRTELLSGDINYPIYTLPSISIEVMKILINVFNYEENDIYDNKRIIYLSQPLGEYKELKEGNEEKLIYDVLEKFSSDVIIRPHPRQNYLNTNLTIDTSRNMWELICREKVNNNNVLIGVFSSAQITPKVIYNMEPKLIFLNKIVLRDKCKSQILFDDFLNSLKANYTNDIFIPNSINEFMDIMIKIMEGDDKKNYE